MNVGSAVIQGTEFRNGVKLTDNLKLDLNYTFLRAKDSQTHKYLIYQPKHKIDFSLSFRDLNGFACGLKCQFTDKRFYDTDNTVYVKRFFVLGLNASKKFDNGITWFASVDNLLDKQYDVLRDYPMPGFSLNSGLKFEF